MYLGAKRRYINTLPFLYLDVYPPSVYYTDGIFRTEIEQSAAVSDFEEEILSRYRQIEDAIVDVKGDDAWLVYHSTDTHQRTRPLAAFPHTSRLRL